VDLGQSALAKTMTNIVELNLPHIPIDLQSSLLAFLDQVPLSSDRKQWLDEFHGNTVNCVEHLFYEAPEPWQTQLQTLYQPYFKNHQISIGFGLMRNTTNQPACLPPHTDRARALAINYYAQLGGQNVTTAFYDYQHDTKSQESSNFLYTTVGPSTHTETFETGWYAYNVNQAHSVENINDNRYVILIMPHADTNYDLACFAQDYGKLLVDAHVQ
jgi:hypothetical protein